jgi:hypothetical protein
MKHFSDGEIIKECLETVADVVTRKNISFIKLIYRDSPMEEESRNFKH